MPGMSAELIKHLDTHVAQPTVNSPDEMDPFTLGQKSGRRQIVDALLEWASDTEKRKNE